MRRACDQEEYNGKARMGGEKEFWETTRGKSHKRLLITDQRGEIAKW